MKRFDLKYFTDHPHMKLVAEYYLKNDLEPVKDYKLLSDRKLEIRDPYTDETAILDEKSKSYNANGEWVSTVYMVENIYNPTSLAEKLLGMKSGETIHLVVSNFHEGFTIQRLCVLGADVLILRRWDQEIIMYDAREELVDIHEIELWLFDNMVIDNLEANLYEVDEEIRVNANWEYFDRKYRLTDLRCDEEAWLISDIGSRYEVQANDDHRDICSDDGVALERAKARGIRFREDYPYCPADLLYL